MDRLAYSVPEAAAAVGVSQSTIWAAIKSGDLAALKPKVNGRALRSVRIDATELLAWLRDGEPA